MADKETRDLDGASVLLLGATGVLGRELGRQLLKAGARLTLVGRTESKLAELVLPGL